MQKLFLISLFTFVFFSNLSAQKEVKIWGKAPEYSGAELSFYLEEDFITRTEKTLVTFSPDYEGNFSVSFSINETRQLNIDLGAYNGILYTEPGKEYQIVLPPRVEKTKKEAYNPYYVPENIYLGVLNHQQKDLNTLIANLEDSIATRLEPGLQILKNSANRIALEKILLRIDSFFKDKKHPYFLQYKQYRYNALHCFVYLYDNEHALKKYFAKEPILLHVPTYTTLFEKLVKHGLTLKASKRKWSAYYTIEKKLGIENLKDSLKRFPYLGQKEFMDLYIANGLHNIFYNKNFTQNNVLLLLNELRTNTSPRLQPLVDRVYERLTHLRPGSLAPDLKLFNSKGKPILLSEYTGKYIYLAFGTAWSVPFVQELELMKKLQSKQVKDLVIITVSMDKDFQKMLKLKEKNNYDWTFLHYDFQPSVAETYRLKVYPTYYLIGPDGSLIMSPAPSIAENFLERFFPIYQNWKREQYKIQQGIKN